MLVTLEFTDAGSKSGTHRVLMMGLSTDSLQAGDVGLSLEEAKTTPPVLTVPNDSGARR
jgi:hypothetical protein